MVAFCSYLTHILSKLNDGGGDENREVTNANEDGNLDFN